MKLGQQLVQQLTRKLRIHYPPLQLHNQHHQLRFLNAETVKAIEPSPFQVCNGSENLCSCK